MKIPFLNKNLTFTKSNSQTSQTSGSWGGSSPSVNFLFNQRTGDIIGTPRFTTFENEIYHNSTIQTVINKQLSIASQTELKLFENKQGKDTETTNEGANKLLNALLNPNTSPAMLHWSDIVKYFFQRYFTHGVGALIFTYNGGFEKDIKYQTIYETSNEEQRQNAKRNNIRLMSQLEIQSVQPAKTVYYCNNYGRLEYKINLYDDYNFELTFTQDSNLQGFYTARANNKFYIAFIFGDYDFQTSKYQTFLEHIKPSIILENEIEKTIGSFYKNACMPSSIIEVKPSLSTPQVEQYFLTKFGIGNEEHEKFKLAMQELEAELKSSVNSGKPLISKDPRISFNVIPLQITPDADNAIKLTEMAKDKIYSFFAGGSRSAYEGKTEYASNAEPKIKELYDGTIGFVKSNLIDELNRFLRVYLTTFRIAPPSQIKNFYFALDTSFIQYYKDYQTDLYSQDYKNGIITLNEIRARKGILDEVNYGDLTDLPNGDRTFQELSKSVNQL